MSTRRFTSIVNRTADGQTTKILEPAHDRDTYYLVVPTNASHEGSYGVNSDSEQRPFSTLPCRRQQIVPCFDRGTL